MRNLKHPYLRVEKNHTMAYGGNQSWFPYKFLRNCGCGVISAADVLLHLRGKENLSEKEYMDFAKKLWKYYLPVIPGMGMNGLTLMIGLNRYFIKHKMPHRAFWNMSGSKMVSRIDEMLKKDIPVIFSIGPNFPKFWGKEKLNLYIKGGEAEYIPVTKVKAHFVTITGREGKYLQISSWGKAYYIDLREYRTYVKKHSSFLVSNIMYIT